MFWVTDTYKNRLSGPQKRNWKCGPGSDTRVWHFFIPPQHAPPPAADQHPESNAKPGHTVIGRDITTFTRERHRRRRRRSSRRRSRRALGPRPLPRVQQTATVEGRARVTMAKSCAHKSIFVHGGRPTIATTAAVAHATHTTYVYLYNTLHVYIRAPDEFLCFQKTDPPDHTTHQRNSDFNNTALYMYSTRYCNRTGQQKSHD